MTVWFIDGCLMAIAFVFGVHIRVYIVSCDMTGHGVTWQSILLHGYSTYVCMGLMNVLSHGFTWKPSLLEIQMRCKVKTKFIQKFNFFS